MATEFKTTVIRTYANNANLINDFILRASQGTTNEFKDSNVLALEYKGETGLYIDVFETLAIQDTSNISAVYVFLRDNNRETQAENRYRFNVSFGDVMFDTTQFSIGNCANIADNLAVSLGDFSDVENLDIVLQIIVILK